MAINVAISMERLGASRSAALVNATKRPQVCGEVTFSKKALLPYQSRARKRRAAVKLETT